MKHAEVTFRFLTPCLMAGADQTQAEMRSPSIRGALRWWMRALGYDCALVNELFGSASGQQGQRSNVIVRDTTEQPLRFKAQSAKDLTGSDFDYFMWPLRKGLRGVINAGATASFAVLLRKGESEELEKALKAFLLMGALGTRSRRCYGSIWPQRVTIDGKVWSIPNTAQALQTELETIFDERSNSAFYLLNEDGYSKYQDAITESAQFLKSFRCGSRKSGTPSKWGKNDHDAPFKRNPEVYRPVLGLPLVQRYSSSGAIVTTEISGYLRLASPVHFKVVALNGKFYPAIMFFYSMMPDEDTEITLSEKNRTMNKPMLSWNILDGMLEDISENGQTLGEFY